MFSPLAIVGGVVILAILVLLVIAATKPNEFTVQRSATFQTTAEKIFPLINDLKNWEHWSPWDKLDPTMKKKVSGSDFGTGAIYEWDGNQKVGAGRMEIVDSTPPNKVVIQLDFLRPFKARNQTEFVLSSQANSTTVTWVMRGSQPFMGKVMSILMNMDRLIGKDFETGLNNLKSVVEK